MLFADAREIIAKAIHKKYLRDQKGRKKSTDPAMKPWEELSGSLQESNRHQADDIPRKLERIGYGFSTAPNKKPVRIQFKDEEVEILAEMEHERWVEDRLALGWRHGKERDPDQKITPDLVPWNELPDEIKEYDRDAVRGIPEFMASANFEIYPLKGPR